MGEGVGEEGEGWCSTMSMAARAALLSAVSVRACCLEAVGEDEDVGTLGPWPLMAGCLTAAAEAGPGSPGGGGAIASEGASDDEDLVGAIKVR